MDFKPNLLQAEAVAAMWLENAPPNVKIVRWFCIDWFDFVSAWCIAFVLSPQAKHFETFAED